MALQMLGLVICLLKRTKDTLKFLILKKNAGSYQIQEIILRLLTTVFKRKLRPFAVTYTATEV